MINTSRFTLRIKSTNTIELLDQYQKLSGANATDIINDCLDLALPQIIQKKSAAIKVSVAEPSIAASNFSSEKLESLLEEMLKYQHVIAARQQVEMHMKSAIFKMIKYMCSEGSNYTSLSNSHILSLGESLPEIFSEKEKEYIKVFLGGDDIE